MTIDRAALPSNQTVQIEPGQENLEIQYTGLSFSRPEQVKFKYQLVGLDHDWVDAGVRRTAYYSHLPPGAYTFRVMAENGDGVWSERAASLAIVVRPPFWRTWWFLSLALMSIVGLSFLTYRQRVRRLKRAHAAQEDFSRQLLDSQERERQRIAAELHDGLGQSLLIIKNRAFLALSAMEDRDGAEEQLNEISAAASQAVEEVRDITYNLRPYYLDRFGLTKSLQAIFTQVNGTSGINFTTEIDPIDDLFSKPAEISIYRIVQESVNNIIKHSQATEAKLVIRREGDELRVWVRDNGRGFTPGEGTGVEPRRSGFGLVGTAERVRMLGGSYAVDSAPGQGTTITIKLTIPGGAHEN